MCAPAAIERVGERERTGERRLLDAAAVRQAEDRDGEPIERAEAGGEAADGVRGHGVVGAARSGGDLGVGITGEVEVRVDGDAVSADRDAGSVDVAERLAVARVDHLEDVDVVLIGVAGELVGEADVDVAVGRLGQLGQLGRLAAAEVPHAVRSGQVVALVELQRRFVERDRQLGAGLVDAADQLRIAAQVGEDPARVDAFRAERDEQIVAEPTARTRAASAGANRCRVVPTGSVVS